jgi:hypothetical protein
MNEGMCRGAEPYFSTLFHHDDDDDDDVKREEKEEKLCVLMFLQIQKVR